MKKYRFLEHTADVKFEAFGTTLSELFKNSALAMCNAMYETNAVEDKESLKIELRAPSIEQLLHKFLSEILFQMDTKQMLFSNFRLKIEEKQSALKGGLLGEKINKKKHTLKAWAKAVSWYEFKVKKQGRGWKCTAIVDV